MASPYIARTVHDLIDIFTGIQWERHSPPKGGKMAIGLLGKAANQRIVFVVLENAELEIEQLPDNAWTRFFRFGCKVITHTGEAVLSTSNEDLTINDRTGAYHCPADGPLTIKATYWFGALNFPNTPKSIKALIEPDHAAKT